MPTRMLFELLKLNVDRDPWRIQAGFSDDVALANESLFAATPEKHASILRDWLRHHQPCLFGKLAASADLMSFCTLTEADLEQGDEYVRGKIQTVRTQWKAEAYEGRKSGFVIALVSRDLANSPPGPKILDLAKRLLELYLLFSVAYADTIYLESVQLEQPGRPPHAWQWDVGVNYFAAHGDKRWWHDHRIPGGIAFSMNSVGHMVKSDQLSHALEQYGAALGTTQEAEYSKVDSLGKALQLAMRTIYNAQIGASGKATRLVTKEELAPELECPHKLHPPLDQYNHCVYRGYYHTDQTLPATYFVPEVERPSSREESDLDFTYLFDDRLDNPEFLRLGAGVPIRADGSATCSSNGSKAGKMWPKEMDQKAEPSED